MSVTDSSAPDVVYLVKNSELNDSEELRYSLRSLQNLRHNKVFIVGEKPSWAQNIQFIPVPQNLTKSQNVKNNLIAALYSEDVSEDFIMMNDDFFVMKPVFDMPLLDMGPMSNVIASYETRYPEGSPYIDTMKMLRNILIDKGVLNPVSYELHVPIPLNKSHVKTLYEKSPDGLYQFRTAYGNSIDVEGRTIIDPKIFLENRHNPIEYQKDPEAYLNSQTFLSATGGSFKSGRVGEYIKAQLSEPSRYEA